MVVVEAAAFMVVAGVVASTAAVGAAFMAASQAADITVVTAGTTVDMAATVGAQGSPVAAAHLGACAADRPLAEVQARRDPGPGRDAEVRVIPRPAGILSDPGMERAWRAQAADRSLVLPAERALEMRVEDQAV